MIAIVIPSIRPESWKIFNEGWKDLIEKHKATLITVWDGENPILNHDGREFTVESIMGNDSDLIYNFNDGVRNLGFAYVAKYLPQADYIITLDDDTLPYNDTIQDHLDALNSKVPVSWLSTASEFMRGFPYGIREEAEVVLSHGVWHGVADWDAATQLILGNRPVDFYKGPIPKGIFYPMCIMNVGFKRKLLPYFYQAPMGKKVGLDRFADIWSGIESKKVIDSKGWAVYSGKAAVRHERASNVFTNLKKEARGLEFNEDFWQKEIDDDYFKMYAKNRKRWEKFIKQYVS